MHLSRPEIESKTTSIALLLLLVAIWLLMHGYHGLTGDAQIYAFQALARIHPQLATDLYLQDTSQDQFTVFSPLYAWFIGLLGLETAARLLTVIFAVWLLAAAWNVACAVTSRHAAWLAVATLLIFAGDYGGSGVFHLLEPYLSARLPAEAMIITAIACHFRGMERIGLLLAIGALFVHPLIALPGLLLLICLRLPGRVILMGSLGGALATLGIALAATILPYFSHAPIIMDTAWLEVVQERSQFLFLQLWSFHDWTTNARPFIYLAFAAIAVPEERIRKFCTASAVVGASGLAVALIGSLIGPVAILVQGQAWRWLWITVFISALLLPVTTLQVWRDEKCGPLCGILLALGWTLSAADGTACVLLALFFWSTRTHIGLRFVPYLRWASLALGIGVACWILTKSCAIISAPASGSRSTPRGSAQILDIFGLRVSAALFSVLLWWSIRSSRTIWVPAILSMLLLGLSILVWPAAFKQSHTLASASDIDEVADWTNAIPTTSTVLVAPTHDVGAFVWFTLGRPNYLAVDQSAGVVFSRTTALEVRRRSQVLLPLMDPNWKILTHLRASSGNEHKADAPTRPLTSESLVQVCADPQLGFVISPEDVGFNPLRHEHPGIWKNWNLYDCRNVRSSVPAI
jgi:hypothetical protein